MTKQYNLFGLATLIVNTRNRNYIRFFDNEYKYLESTGQPELTITIEIVPKLPIPGGQDIIRSERFVKLFRYSYLIRDLESNHPKIYFKDHPVAWFYINAIAVFVQAQLLDPVLYYKLLDRNILLMHAAGVTLRNHSCLFPAHGGTGKTTTALKFVSQGFKLLGDDLIVIDPDRRLALAYPRPFHLFEYNIESLEGARLPLSVLIKIRLKNLIRKVLEWLLRQRFLISTRVHASELYQEPLFVKQAGIKAIALLRKTGPGLEINKISAESAGKLALVIVDTADLNDSLVQNILPDQQAVNQFRKSELDCTTRTLLMFDQVYLVNVRALDAKAWREFVDAIKHDLTAASPR